MPGHSGEVCSKCPAGTYKNTVGLGSCLDCMNKPDNAEYSNATDAVQPQCPVVCSQDTLPVDTNPNCYPQFYYYVNKMGGYPGVIGIALTLIIFLIVVLIRFARKKKKIFKESVDRNQYYFDDVNMEKGALKFFISLLLLSLVMRKGRNCQK